MIKIRKHMFTVPWSLMRKKFCLRSLTITSSSGWKRRCSPLTRMHFLLPKIPSMSWARVFHAARYIKVGGMFVQNVQFFINFCYKKFGLGPFDTTLPLVVLIILKDLFDIIAGRLEGRNSLILFNLPRTGIIGCQG